MKPWEQQLIKSQGDGTLVHIARQGRLNHNGNKVDLTWIDEAALALVEAAVAQGQTLNLVYPAPAGEVAVLLAAQILIRGFIDKSKCVSVGILTADAPNAARMWDDLALTSRGSRAPIREVFPCYRPSIEGRSPSPGKLRGVLIGNNCHGWPVDVTIDDHLAGPTMGKPRGTIIRIFADPLDPVLDEIGRRGELIWGWSDSILQLWHDELDARPSNTVPFSVAEDRFKTISKGVEITLQVCQHEFAEKPLAKVREDLRALSAAVGPTPGRRIELGLRVAWSHVATLAALPCRPNEYDEFCGVPPRAARATATFAKEIEAWSATLDENQKEYGMILASDLADLRRALEMGSAFRSPLLSLAHADHRSLAILRTRTASKALFKSIGGNPDAEECDNLRTAWYGKLHLQDSHPNGVVVGMPARSAWHRIDSGLAGKLTVLVMGENEAKRARWAIATLKAARARWASLEQREKVWRALIGTPVPPPHLDVPYEPPKVTEIAGPEFAAEPDPFSPLGAIMVDDRPLLCDEGSDEQVAREVDGDWSGFVKAVDISTDHGDILLPSDQEVDVLEGGEPKLVDAEELKPGMRIVIGRRSGRIGLLEALEEKLKGREDLMLARFLIEDYRVCARKAFAESKLSVMKLVEKLTATGCKKAYHTIRSWVTSGGPMAPRDKEDLVMLNKELSIGFSPDKLRAVGGALSKLRGFRRNAGRALAEAAQAAAHAGDRSKRDPTTGFSVADLQEAVIVAKVLSLKPVPEPVPLTETGRLKET